MALISEIITMARRPLKDTGSTPRWVDATLLAYAIEKLGA